MSVPGEVPGVVIEYRAGIVHYSGEKENNQYCLIFGQGGSE